MNSIQFVDVSTARARGGVRLVVSGAIPSPWSEAAKGLFHMKEIPVLGVRYRRADEDLAAWTGPRNVPVLLIDDDPPRTGWAEIVTATERMGGRAPLVPSDTERRVRMFGLINELAGEGGLGWNSRLFMIHGSFTSDGTKGFPLPVAQFLAPKYGYAAERMAIARDRIVEVLQTFDEILRESGANGHTYLLGAEPSALDIYLATFLTPLFGASEADCPNMRPELRAAFAHLTEQMRTEVTPALAAHRAQMFKRHLPWPIML